MKFKIFYYFYIDFLKFLYALRNKTKLKVTKDIQIKRFNICESCPLINRKGILAKLKGPRCGVCGCVLAWKVLFNFEECPDKENKRWFMEGLFPEKK